MLTGKRANNGYTVSFSHIRNKKLQQANLQVRVKGRLMSPVGLRVCFPQRCHNSSFFYPPSFGFSQPEFTSKAHLLKLLFLSPFQLFLQYKRVYWPEQKRYIRLRISTKAIKTLNKVGLEKMAKDAGLDLMSLAYQQADEARAEWLAANAGEEPTRKDKRAPTGPKKLYIPKWKEARMSKLSPEEKEAETKRFAEKYNMTLA